MRLTTLIGRTGLLALGAVLLSGCHLDMWTQAKYKPQDESGLFVDGQASRPFVANTVPRDKTRLDTVYFTGYQRGGRKLVATIPPAAFAKFNNNTKAMLLRGQYQFNNYCQPCHGRSGDGLGMITRRGLGQRRMPANFHSDKLRQIEIGHFYDVITNGYGVMYPYASRVQPEDRWAISAYIRALQLSQNARMIDVPAEFRDDLVGGGPNTKIAPGGDGYPGVESPARDDAGSSGTAPAALEPGEQQGGAR